jgi:hypothetical protein
MNTKNKNDEKMVTISEKELLLLVTDKLKDRVLFPEKVAYLKESLKNTASLKK